jgi:hypothetical protein
MVQLAALILGLISFILFFASYMVGRKVTPSDSDRKNAQNLQLAGMVFLALSLIAGTIIFFKPTFGATYLARATTTPAVTATTR